MKNKITVNDLFKALAPTVDTVHLFLEVVKNYPENTWPGIIAAVAAFDISCIGVWNFTQAELVRLGEEADTAAKAEPVALHEQLRAERRLAGLTQAALADKAGCTPRTIVALEQGDNVTAAVAHSVAKALGGRLVWRSDTRR